MFEMTTCRVMVLDQLHPEALYILATELEDEELRRHPAGMEFRYQFAVVNLRSGDAEVHGLGPDGRGVVFRTRAHGHKTRFIATGR